MGICTKGDCGKMKTYITNPKAIIKKWERNKTNKPIEEIKMNYEKYPTDLKKRRKKGTR